eukprot:gene973-287_t
MTTQTQECYKGMRVNKNWLCSHFKDVIKPIKIGKRNGLKCILCNDNMSSAVKASRNGMVPMAEGVRADGAKELRRVIDHLISNVHRASEKQAEMQRLWEAQSEKHPWVRVLKSLETQTFNTLVELAIDVYNDSQIKTFSANSWPSRSLSHIHAANQMNQYHDHGLDVKFQKFQPSPQILHYRNPNAYNEMLQIVASLEMKKIVDELSSCEAFSLQVDGSVDKYQVDNKFITARYMDKERAMRSVLKKTIPCSALSKLLQCFMTAMPHSLSTERVFSSHTELKSSKRSSTSRNTVNCRLIIEINGKGTAHFDPCPAVAKFLTAKDRRNRQPDEEVYQSRDFIKQFFSS